MMTPVTVRILDSIRGVAREAWNAMVPPGAPPVLRWEWIDALESSGSASPEKGWAPHHLIALRGSQVVAAAPAYRKFHSLGEYVYDFAWAHAAEQAGLAYYPKLLLGVPLSPLTAPRFLVAPGESLGTLREVLLEAARTSARETGCSSVHVIFPDDAEAGALEDLGLFRRLGMQYHWRNDGYRTYDDYLARFDSKRRNQFKRERSAAAAQGLTVRTLRGHELGPAHAELAWRFYESTASAHAWGPVQLNGDFFHRAFAALPEGIELVVAERGKDVVAGAFNLHTPTRLYGRYWGSFEPLPFLHFHVCLYHSIDDAIARGLAVFEPGAGGEHKVSRGFVPTAIHSAHAVFDRRLERAIRDFCRRETDEVRAVLAQGERLAGLKPRAEASL